MTTKRGSIDLEKVKKNWERVSTLRPADWPSQRRIEVPDRIRSGRELLERVRALVLKDYAKHREALVPFLDRAAELIEAMEGAAREDDERLRGELLEVLYDFEDLLEVYAMMAR